jgi:hypothetical protein
VVVVPFPTRVVRLFLRGMRRFRNSQEAFVTFVPSW